ncbi:MAG: STAS domain-containing protein [Planctomycetota bacterium]
MSQESDTIAREDRDGAVVLSPSGDIDMSRSPLLREAITKARGDKPARIVVDLVDVGYMDSSGLATLVEAMKLVRGTGTALVLCAMNERVRAIFEIARLEQYFTIRADLEAALGGD